MRIARPLVGLAILLSSAAAPTAAQTFPTNNRVIRNMWEQGMGAGSQIERLAQQLADSIGPRLNASPGYYAAVDWAMKQYEGWRIPARKEQYGTWMSWRRGYTHLDLTTPRSRTLAGTMLAFSPGTKGPVEGDVVVFPELENPAAYDRWMAAGVRGKFILLTSPEPTCRPYENLTQLALPATVRGLGAQHDSLVMSWSRRYQRSGSGLVRRLEDAGAVGFLTNLWSDGWGVDKLQDPATILGQNTRVPTLDVSCEDYGLLYRLAERNQTPRVRLDADAENLGEKPVYNIVGELRGSQLPDEYVVISAHFDSWDSASGATDNGTGTLMMMEAMRILKATYPNPKRTILVVHYGGEEQGEYGSVAFAADHAEIVKGLQIGFNQDNGTWRIEALRMQGFNQAKESVGRWLRVMPHEIADTVQLDSPVREGGSDHSSFTCYGIPFVRLQSNYPDYRQYTWHTNLDTYDKIILDDLKNNATLIAMLAYQASEDPQKVSRVRDPLLDSQGKPGEYPKCSPAVRSSTER